MFNQAFYYLTGPDGSGKTFYLEELERYFLSKGIRTVHVWLRSPKILSKPLMAYCRIVGLTKYTTINGVRYGGHFFQRSKMVCWLYPWLQLIDFRLKLKSLRDKFQHDHIVLMDRFALDTLADLMVDTGRFDLHKTRIGQMFIKMIPRSAHIIVLSTSGKNIRERKTDTLYDPLLEKKIKVYTVLSKDLGLEVVDNNRDLLTVKKELLDKFPL